MLHFHNLNNLPHEIHLFLIELYMLVQVYKS